MSNCEHAEMSPVEKTQGLGGSLLRGLFWGESFVCLGFHFFWVLGKSTPLAAESALGAAILTCAPFALALLVGLLMSLRPVKAAILGIEWLLHLSAAISFFILMSYLILQDPFALWLPYSVPIGLWSVGLAFTLVANMAAHVRGAGQEETGKPWRYLVLGVLLWAILLMLISGMTWPSYFWTAQIILHAIGAVFAARSVMIQKASSLPKLPIRFSTGLEALLVISILLLSQLRLVGVSNLIGMLELKSVEILSLFTSPFFFLGVVIVLIALRFRFLWLSHIALAILLFFGFEQELWAIPLAIGYGLTALFFLSKSLGAFEYVLLSLLICIVWILGQLGFSLSGLIFTHDIGQNAVAQLIDMARIATPILLLLWLPLKWFSSRNAAPRDTSEELYELLRAPRWTATLLYALLLCLALAPAVGMMAWGGWYGQAITQPDKVAIEDPFAICHAGNSRSDEEYQELHKLGVTLMRVDFSWARIQPDKDTWDFSRWDAYLDAAEKNDMKVLALLDFDNNAVETSDVGSKRNVYIAPEDIPLFLDYVRRTVSRYQDRVYAWEIWNEPDMARFWRGTKEEFYELARQTAQTIRETAPSVTIIGSAMTSALGAYTTPMLDGMFSSGAMDQVDKPSCHLYIPDPRGYYNEYSKVLATARKHGHSGAPWITETGDPDGGGYSWRASSDLLAEHVIKSHTIALALGMEKIVWYCYHDSRLESQLESRNNSECFFGLVTHEGQWKPAAHAYRLFTEHGNNSTMRKDLINVSGGLGARQLRSALYQRENGESALVLWFEPFLRPAAHARVKIDFGAIEGTPILHDITSPYTKPFLDEVIDVTEKPVFISFKTTDTETPLKLKVTSSPADGLWLMLLAALLLWAFVASWAGLAENTAK